MRLMKRTTQQHTDVLKILVPSLLEIIFTLSRFIGPKILMCVFKLSLARMPRAFWCRCSSGYNYKGAAFGFFSVHRPGEEVHDERATWLRAGEIGEGLEGEGGIH